MAEQPNRAQQRESLDATQESSKSFNKEVRDTVRDVSKLIAASEKLAAKLSSMSASEINVKNIAKELTKAKEQQYIIESKLSNVDNTSKIAAQEYLRLVQERSVEEKKLQDIIQSGTKEEIKLQQELLAAYEEQIEIQGQSAQTIQAAALIQQSEEASYMVEATQQRLELEQKIAKQLGITGGLIGKVAKNLGIGDAVYSSMVKKAKELNGEASVFQIAGAGLKGGLGAGMDMLKSLDVIPVFGAIIGGIAKGLKAALDFILEIDDRTTKFARTLGVSKDEAATISERFGDIATNSGNLLLTTKNLQEAQSDLVKELGVTNILSDEMLETQISLKKVMGLSADEMGSLAEASILSGKAQKQVVTGILGQVASLKSATGIAFNYKQIIGEASKLGGVLGLKFAKYPESLTKSLVATKALGMDLAKVDQIAGSLLNFEDSIQNQLEAQLLTGKDINLSRAQQLALEGDTAGVAQELSKAIGNSNEFLKMNRIQQESIAKAVGMSREDIGETLKKQEMLSKLGAKDIKEAQAKVELLKAQGKTQKEIAALLGEEAYQNLTQLSAQEKIAELIEKVKGAFQDFVQKSGIVDYIVGIIDYLTNPDNVKSLINTIKTGVAWVADAIQQITIGVLRFLDYIPGVETGEMADELEDYGSVGDRIRNTGGAGNSAEFKDFIIKPLGEDTITMAGGTKLGRTDEMVDLLKQILGETKQGKVMSFSIDGAPVATAVARNAPMNPSASNLGPRPLR